MGRAAGSRGPGPRPPGCFTLGRSAVPPGGGEPLPPRSGPRASSRLPLPRGGAAQPKGRPPRTLLHAAVPRCPSPAVAAAQPKGRPPRTLLHVAVPRCPSPEVAAAQPKGRPPRTLLHAAVPRCPSPEVAQLSPRDAHPGHCSTRLFPAAPPQRWRSSAQGTPTPDTAPRGCSRLPLPRVAAAQPKGRPPRTLLHAAVPGCPSPEVVASQYRPSCA
ncbi:basic salivary proline-rich protein 1-like [Gopherus flavomarginatus]|uniref:basic salivary proline-rich protein 1-like n=1 Tax=Gopherus flavomarginatus TaxID=286002 RepID=UPI0021CC085F|nr:basic salivary proline-rich protein 1-like [Gopherus flavomarginatus]